MFRFRRRTEYSVLPSHIDLVKDLLNVRNSCRELLRLLALPRGLDLSRQGQHSILGGVTDVLFIQPACDQSSLIVLFDAVIPSRCRVFRLRFSAYWLNANFVGYNSGSCSRLSYVCGPRLCFVGV